MRPGLTPVAFIVIILLMGVLAAGNYLVVQAGPIGEAILGRLSALSGDGAAASLAYFVGAPLVTGVLLLLILPRCVAAGADSETEAPAPHPSKEQAQPKKPAAPAKPNSDAAIHLLALLQREGRLVDFLREDIDSYDDAQVGAAVRSIHASCRQVLAEHLSIEPVLGGAEGDAVTVPEDFDPSTIRLTGNVSGEAPFRGALRHAGWRAASVTLPEQPRGQNPQVIAPAEVEIP